MTKPKTVQLLPISRQRVNGPVRLCVPFSIEQRKLVHGIPADREKALETFWKEGLLDRPDENYYFVVPKGGKTLNISVPADEQEYYVALANKTLIAPSKRDIDKYPEALFFIHDEEEEADQVLDDYTAKANAYSIFKEMNISKKRRVLRLFGLRTDRTSDKVVEKKLIEMIEASPKRFNGMVSDPNLEQRMLLAELIEYSIITKSGPVYKYGEDVLGADEEQAVAFIKNPKHSSLVSQLNLMLNERKDIKSINA